MAQAAQPDHVLFHVNPGVGEAFSWISIGLAIFTAFLQGLVTAIASMTEHASRWTFRFRLAHFEHWWWTIVSVLLLASLVMNGLSFASGNGGEPISVLALATTTFLAIVRYTLPAWQNRHYNRTRWWAWTGDSRTGIPRDHGGFCGNAKTWRALVAANRNSLANFEQTPSDKYGWQLWPVGGIPEDPTDVLNVANAHQSPILRITDKERFEHIYDDGDETSKNVSLLWGHAQGFRRRVSRAVSSMPKGLLRSNPETTDGYDGKGLTLAMGILGRNKGLAPSNLVFKMTRPTSTFMENTSTWRPRPQKVLRSFYHRTLESQYSFLGTDYIAAAVELALLMSDIPYWAIDKWLSQSLEHQLISVNRDLRTRLQNADVAERRASLKAHYESSYVSMIISLNYMNGEMKNRHHQQHVLTRPDILCTGLLLKARGLDEPSWWNDGDISDRRQNEMQFLNPAFKQPAAWLLGLGDWPPGFESTHSVW
jgi:hypothetical protein